MTVHLVVRAGLEPESSRFQVWRSNHSTTMPPFEKSHEKPTKRTRMKTA